MGERVQNSLEDIKGQIVQDVIFVTDKMTAMREKIKDSNYLDIHQMVDFHRYSEARLFLVKTLESIEGADKKHG